MILKKIKKNLIKTLARLVYELKNKLSEYDTIISDETSGRLPSLFMRQIINKKKKELGQSPVVTYFINAGKKRLKHNQEVSEAKKEFFKKKRGSIQKALIVTEHIQTGGSIRSLLYHVIDSGINCDVATVSMAKKPTAFSRDDYDDGLYKPLVNRLYYGTMFDNNDSRTIGTLFMGKKTGVSKVTSKNTHPDRLPLAQEGEYESAKEQIGLIDDKIINTNRGSKEYKELINKLHELYSVLGKPSPEQLKKSREEVRILASELSKLI